MRVGEFELIRQLAGAQTLRREEVVLGIGDDAAILNIPDDHELVVSTDTLNIGVHFPETTPAESIGYKSLAVSLSDLAAMGAEPLAANLSLSLPESDAAWIAEFANGFFELANRYNVQLIGGDTTRGSLSISVTIFGQLPKGQAIRRSGAQAGDLIYVTGTLGDAGAALLALQGELKISGPQQKALMQRLDRPEPRVEWGQALRGIASACIDLSDGLAADIGHLVDMSNGNQGDSEQSVCGASLMVDQLPLSETLRECFDLAGGWTLPLQAGDDYELCFTVPENRQAELEALKSRIETPISQVGFIEKMTGLHLQMPDGSMETIAPKGYAHFQAHSYADTE